MGGPVSDLGHTYFLISTLSDFDSCRWLISLVAQALILGSIYSKSGDGLTIPTIKLSFSFEAKGRRPTYSVTSSMGHMGVSRKSPNGSPRRET